MYTNLFFLVFALLIVSLVPEISPTPWVADPWEALLLGIGGFFVLLGAIALQIQLLKSKKKGRARWLLVLTNLELIAFLLVYHILLVAHRPYAQHITSIAFVSLGMYFTAQGLFHYLINGKYSRSTRRGEALRQSRALLPFVLPFLCLSVILDLLSYLPASEGWITVATFLLLGALLLFLPWMLTKVWGCQPLPPGPTPQRLAAFCERIGFKHAGLCSWQVMNPSPTAAIVGVLPQFRYILFTRRLLEALTPEQAVAVLAHEVTHSRRRHLLFYPLIMGGMVLLAFLYNQLVEPSLAEWLTNHRGSYPSPWWDSLRTLAFLAPYIIIFGGYFRLVFGYFSRLFERQADLAPFDFGLDPTDMQEALYQIGVATGHTHHHPSWHHHSLQQRIDFLEEAKRHPDLVGRHHALVRCALAVYFVIFTAGCLTLTLI